MRKNNFLILSRMIMCAICLSILALPASVGAEDGYDWQNHSKITAVGYRENCPEKSDSVNNAGDKAMEQARLNLIKKIMSIPITAKETVDMDAAKSAATLSAVIGEKKDAKGGAKITLGLSVYGEQSLMTVLLKPYAKEPLPKINDENYSSRRTSTALIIDCAEWEDKNKTLLNPVLLPEIKDAEGRIIYGVKHLDRDTAIKNGVVKYAPDIKSSAAGDDVLVIRIQDISDDLSNPVISVEDAKKIIGENLSGHFLDNANVVIVSRSVDIDVQYERGGKSWGIRDSDGYSYE